MRGWPCNTATVVAWQLKLEDGGGADASLLGQVAQDVAARVCGLGGRFSGVPLQRCNGRSEDLDGVGGAGAATLVVAGFAWRATPQQQLEVCDSVSAMADGRGAIVSYSVIVCFFAC